MVWKHNKSSQKRSSRKLIKVFFRSHKYFNTKIATCTAQLCPCAMLVTAGPHAFPKHLNLQQPKTALSNKNKAAATQNSSYKPHFALLALCIQRGTGATKEFVAHTPANSQLRTPHNISAVPLLAQNIPSSISSINKAILIMHSQPLLSQGEALQMKALLRTLSSPPSQSKIFSCYVIYWNSRYYLYDKTDYLKNCPKKSLQT